ncbi:MAG: hypothetical protein A2Y94_00530 [Caldithrix sp. RBG_13_44_9]|nr:MAG: hypothetical protein A2Y94_00530 [Caldithrix sp. RBG_13_44_9]
MKKYLTFALTFLSINLLIINCSIEKNPVSTVAFLADEQKAAIYQAVLDSMVLLVGVERIVFKDSTDFFPLTEEIYSQIPDLDPGTLEDFNQRNQNSIPLGRIPGISMEQILLSNQEFQNILVQGGWELFYTRFPESAGLLGMSDIGLSEDGNQALLYFSQFWYYLAGAGQLVFLIKNNDWQITKIVTVWIS